MAFTPKNLTERSPLNHSDDSIRRQARREYMARWRAADRDRERGYKFKHRYGISYQEYERLSAQQNDVCAICRKPESARHNSGAIRRLCVDHDHKTGEIRGLLCLRCNRVLGLMYDDGQLLGDMIAYLKGRL
jgi:hypothetical protein